MARTSLIVLLAFNAVSALGGGVGVMGDAIGLPLSWLRLTPFHSYLVPGIALFAVVGGSAAVALAAVAWRLWSPVWPAAASGVIMVGWIVAEVIWIRQFSWLQLAYLVTGTAVLALAPHAVPPRAVGRPLGSPR